jgi:hypothetical protein
MVLKYESISATGSICAAYKSGEILVGFPRISPTIKASLKV